MFGAHAALATNATMQAMYNYWAAATAQMDSIEGFATTLVFQPLPPSTANVALTNGIGNPWGLPAKAYVCKYHINPRELHNTNARRSLADPNSMD